MHPEVITSLYEEAERRVEWLEKGLKEIVNANVSTLYIKQKAQSILDGEPTTADKYNKEWINGIEHDKQIMLQELKKYFKLKFYNKVCEFRWEEIRRLFSILKGR